MTQQEQQDYNLRCIKFLGLEVNQDDNRVYFETSLFNVITGYESRRHHVEQLCFHLEWSWIHLVIEMIETLGYFVMINRWTSIYSGDEFNRFILASFGGNNKLVNTVKAINEFLIWNENKI